MLLKAARFAGLSLMGVEVGVSYSHALQAPPKRELPADAYLWVHNVLIRNYAVGAGTLEIGAMLSTLAATILGRRRREVAIPNLVAFLCLAAIFGVWAGFIEPINREVRGWTPETIPSHWEEKRERWHRFHSVRLVLAVIGLVALIASALEESSGAVRGKEV